METTTALAILAVASLIAITTSQEVVDPKQGTYVEPKSKKAKCGYSKTLESGQEISFSSPGYPKKYPNNKKCKWNIVSEDPEDILKVTCSDFNIKFSKGCKGDKLRLTDQESVETFCGTGEKKFTTTTDKLRVFFKSNSKGSDTGFKCSVKSISRNADSSTDYTAETSEQSQTTPTTPTSSGSCQCGVANPNRIVGGQEVNPTHKYPWHVGLKKTFHANFWCGGAIINDRYVMTAAHCFFDRFGNRESDKRLVVGVADHDMSSTSDDIPGVTRLVEVEKVILHPSYKASGYDYDIAVLKLKEVLDLSKDKQIRSVCLPPNDDNDYAGSTGIATGWGNLDYGGSQPDELQEVELPILPQSCMGKRVTDTMLCAGYEEGGKDTCQGDSGGPLYVVENNKYFQVGVTSFGDGCANPNSPGVYARVSKFLDWIKTNTADGNYCN